MTTIVKTKNVNVKIDTGLDHGSIFSRDELVASIAILEADMAAKKKKRDELRQYAVDAGLAQWKLSKDGKDTPKAPDMAWWTTHRAASFEKQCAATEHPDHPDHKSFWKKPSKTFAMI